MEEERKKELEDYLARETDENIARGMTAEEARRVAHVKLGSMRRIREEIHDMNRRRWLDTLWQDLKYTARMLRKSPGFTAVAIFTLALGIGANTAIFSIINAVLLRPLPYRDPQNLVLLSEHWPQFPTLSLSYLNYKDWRDQSHSFEAVGAVRNTVVTMTGNGEAERIPAQNVTANLFDLLGVQPELGRAIAPEEDTAGGPPVALISHSLWQRRFSSSRAVLGQSITLDNKAYSIIGVMPPGFEVLLQTPDVILAFEPWARTLPDDRSWHPGILPIARLKPGVSIDSARADIATIAARLEKEYPETNRNVSSLVDRMQDQIVGNARTALLILLAAVGAVLLIACVNVANLLLVRATGRRREIAVRLALGAQHSDLIRQLVTESVLLAVLGAAVGLALARAVLPTVVRLAGNGLPRSNSVGVDGYVLVVTALIALIAGVIFGVVPARQAWRIDLHETLGESSRGGSPISVLRTREVLVVCEIVLAMVLLAGAGLLLRSFERLSQVSPGFSADHILVASIVRSPSAYRDPNVRLSFFDELFDRVSALPGVRSAGGVSFLPVTGTGSALHFNIQGRPPKSPDEYTIASYRVVSAGYIKTFGSAPADRPLAGGKRPGNSAGGCAGEFDIRQDLLSQSLAAWPAHPTGSHARQGYSVDGDRGSGRRREAISGKRVGGGDVRAVSPGRQSPSGVRAVAGGADGPRPTCGSERHTNRRAWARSQPADHRISDHGSKHRAIRVPAAVPYRPAGHFRRDCAGSRGRGHLRGNGVLRGAANARAGSADGTGSVENAGVSTGRGTRTETNTAGRGDWDGRDARGHAVLVEPAVQRAFVRPADFDLRGGGIVNRVSLRVLPSGAKGDASGSDGSAPL